jgi:hypothetical protein
MVLHKNVFNSEEKKGYIQFVITQENKLNRRSKIRDNNRTFPKNFDIGLLAMEVRRFKNRDELNRNLSSK